MGMFYSLTHFSHSHFLGDRSLQYKITEFMSYTKFPVYKDGVKFNYMCMCSVEFWWLIFCRSTILILLRYSNMSCERIKILFHII